MKGMLQMKRKNGKSLVKNASLNVIKQICTLAFSLITFPYVSRVLGDIAYGRYSFAASIIEYLLIFSASAGGAYAIREGARIKNNDRELSAFASEIFSISCLFNVIAYIVLVFLIALWPKLYSYKGLLIILSLRLMATTIGVEWIFNIFEDFKNITIRQIVVQGLGLLLTLILVHTNKDANLYAVATVIAMSGANVINFMVSRKYVKLTFTTSLKLKKHLRPIMMILCYSAMITIYSNSDIIMLGVIKNDSVVGAYSVAAKIYGIAKNIFIAALTVLLPRISSYLGNNELTKMKAIINKTLNFLLIGLAPAIALLIFYAKQIIMLVAGKDYIQGAESLKLLSVALLFAIVSSLLTTNIMIPNRQEDKITVIVAISAITNVLLNFCLIPIWGASAAALTTVIAELIVCAGALIFTEKYIEFKNIITMLLKILLSCIGMILTLVFISGLQINNIIELFLGSIISCLIYIVCLVLLNLRTLKKCLLVVVNRQ